MTDKALDTDSPSGAGIGEQTIYGGNQQFADHIINQHSNAKFEAHDIKLLKFIAELNIENAHKQAVGNEVAISNDDNVPIAAQENAQQRVTQFLLDHKDAIKTWASRVSKIIITSVFAKYGLSLADVGL